MLLTELRYLDPRIGGMMRIRIIELGDDADPDPPQHGFRYNPSSETLNTGTVPTVCRLCLKAEQCRYSFSQVTNVMETGNVVSF